MIHSSTSISQAGFASRALQLLQKVQHGISPVELVYATHERWPLRPGQTTHARPTLQLSVLDSSFNPPTLAHLALANSLPPSGSSSESSSECSPVIPVPAEPYDALILLLSVRNADKVLEPGDATLAQRLDMMHLLSNDNRSSSASGPGGKSLQTGGNVAVAIIDEPTFVGKSTALLCFLRARLATVMESTGPLDSMSDRRDRPCLSPAPKLTFLLGTDTLVRLFCPKYYPSERAMVRMLQTFLSADQEACRIVCASRRGAFGVNNTLQEMQSTTLGVAHEFITSGRIAFIDIGSEEQTYSSSEVRAKVAIGDESWRRLVTDAVTDYIVKQGLYLGSGRRH